MIEREIKLRVPDLKKLRGKIGKLGFKVLHRRVFEANVVLDTAAASLKGSGRLLRLRQAGGENTLTFKGAPRKGRHKQREEIESKVADFDKAQAIFSAIGFAPKFRYEKYRTEFQRMGESGILMFDETPIGAFVELEGPGYWIDRVAAELGFAKAEYVVESYGLLYFQYCKENSLPATDMIFAKHGRKAYRT